MSTTEEEEKRLSLNSEASASLPIIPTKLCKDASPFKESEYLSDTCDISESACQESENLIKTNLVVNDKANTNIVSYIDQNGDNKILDRYICEKSRTNGEDEEFKSEEQTDFKENEFSETDITKEPVQIILTPEELLLLSKVEILENWNLQELYIKFLRTKWTTSLQEVEELKQRHVNEEKLKMQLAELQRKEQYHIMRLATKEHEIQELGGQIEELKNLTAGGERSLKHSLLDPAVNLLFERMKRDFDTAKSKMEETQNELAAWKFTPDSNTGKQLMAKCRLLIKENEELGRMISSGRLAKLEGDLALQRNFSDELKKSQSELEEFLQEMDEDTEGMQGTILYLQSQLRQAKEKISHLTSQLSTGQGTSNNTPASIVEGADYAEGQFSETGLEPIHTEDSLQHFPDDERTLLENCSERLLVKDTNIEESNLTNKSNGDLMSSDHSHLSDGSNNELESFSKRRKRTHSVLEESGDVERGSDRTSSHTKRTRLERTTETGDVLQTVVENGVTVD